MSEAVLYGIVGLGVLVALVLAKRRWRSSRLLHRARLIAFYVGFAGILALGIIPGATDASTIRIHCGAITGGK